MAHWRQKGPGRWVGGAWTPAAPADGYDRNRNDALDTLASKARTNAFTGQMNLQARQFIALRDWNGIMTRKTYTIQVKIDFDDDARHGVMVEACKQYARDLLASTTMLADNRQPQVALVLEDAFLGMEDIEVMEVSENVLDPRKGRGGK